MRGRRRDRRFTLSAPWEGLLRVPTDVVVERLDEEEVRVVSTAPALHDELLTLDAIGSGAPVTINVRVSGSVPVLIDGVVRHRLRLEIVK